MPAIENQSPVKGSGQRNAGTKDGRLVLAAAIVIGIASVGATGDPPPAGFVPEGISSSPLPAQVEAADSIAVAGVPSATGLAGSLVQTTSGPTIQLGAAGDMIGFSNWEGSGSQTITLVDTRKSWMAVYHIDRSGKIRLVSSRPIDADFSLQLNATSPLPEEIRALRNR